jgi:hypothetical protein
MKCPKLGRRKGLEVIVFIATFGLFGVCQTCAQSPFQTLTQPLPTINQSVVTQYAENFLSSYNALIIQNYRPNHDPTIMRHFRFYEAIGYSFNVTIMWVANDSTRYIGFIFVPILASSPKITVNNSTTLADVYFLGDNDIANINANNNYGLLVDGMSSVSFNNSITNGFEITGYGTSPYIWMANASHLFADPLGSSAGAAQMLFNQDQNTIPKPSTPNPFIAFVTNPLVQAIVEFIGLPSSLIAILGLILHRKSHHPKKKYKGLSQTFPK